MSEEKKQATLKMDLISDNGTEIKEEIRIDVNQWIAIQKILHPKEECKHEWSDPTETWANFHVCLKCKEVKEFLFNNNIDDEK